MKMWIVVALAAVAGFGWAAVWLAGSNPWWLLPLSVAGFLVYRMIFWLRVASHMTESGYLPPEPTGFSRWFLGFGSRLVAFLGVGPVEVKGRENARFAGRLLIAPNHQFQLDFAMVRLAVGTSFRYMTHANQLRGLQGFLGGWTGAFPVESEKKGGGEAAFNAAVAAFSSSRRARMLIFPQGKLVTDNVLRKEDFRYGVARISRKTFENTGEPAAVLPVAIIYKRDPRHRHWSHFIFAPLRRLFGITNYGGNVIVGKPIPVQDLPADPAEATEVIRLKIQELLDSVLQAAPSASAESVRPSRTSTR